MNEAVGKIDSLRPQWTQVSWKRVLFALALTFACLAALLPVAWFLEPWYFAREMGGTSPSLSVTPTRLDNTAVSALAPGRLEYFGFSFQVPWNDIETQKVSKSGAILRFKNGGAMIVFNPAETTGLSKAVHEQAKPLSSVFGARAMSSGYDWMAAELAATPDQIRWWNRARDVRLAVLLGEKSMEMVECTAIYHVANSELRGFQFCDADVAPHRVVVNLFDVNNRRYELIIASRDAAKPAVTQADINAIISSMRPIPHS